MKLLRPLKHSQTLVESLAQDGDAFNEIGAAFQVKGDLKNAWSSAFRLREADVSLSATYVQELQRQGKLHIAVFYKQALRLAPNCGGERAIFVVRRLGAGADPEGHC